jgi:hydrogenase nickel incorporation protein HypB
MKISIKKQILNENDLIAEKNRKLFDSHKIKAFNIMASPGAGKTSVILALAKQLSPQIHIGVIEGDIASRIDTDKIIKEGYLAVQINTGGNCHLDAMMVKKVVRKLPLNKIDLLFIENVGNLVCPANFNLGSHKNIVIASVPEGDDKTYKYPGMFAKADLVMLNKIDLVKAFDFDVKYFTHGLKIINPKAKLILSSCKKNKGISDICDWITT